MKHLYEFNIFDQLARKEEELHRAKIQKKIDLKQGQIYALQQSGDDSVIRAEIAGLKREVSKLKDELLTPLQRKKKRVQKQKADKRRWKKTLSQMQIQDKIERRFQKELTERDKIINKFRCSSFTIIILLQCHPIFFFSIE